MHRALAQKGLQQKQQQKQQPRGGCEAFWCWLRVGCLRCCMERRRFECVDPAAAKCGRHTREQRTLGCSATTADAAARYGRRMYGSHAAAADLSTMLRWHAQAALHLTVRCCHRC